jgi:hypothetical protein
VFHGLYTDGSARSGSGFDIKHVICSNVTDNGHSRLIGIVIPDQGYDSGLCPDVSQLQSLRCVRNLVRNKV